MQGTVDTMLIDALPDPALLLGEHDRILAANERAVELIGRSSTELAGTSLDSILAEDSRVRRADGESIEVEVHIGELGNGVRLLTARDVVEERRTASQLADAERIAGIGIWEWHVPTNVVTWSREAFNLFGHDPATTVPTFELWLESIHPEDREWVNEYVQEAFSSHRDYDFEHRVQRPDGTVRHLHCRGHVVVGTDGEPIRLVGASQDVTERVRKDAELASAAARHEAVLDAAGEGICGLDPDGRVSFANPAAAALLGTSVDALLGERLGERLGAAGDPFLAAITAGRDIRDEGASLRAGDGELVEVAYHCAPIMQGTAGAVVTFSDSSERRRYEERLRFLADHDALTGLLNRRRFEGEVAAQAVYASRYGGSLSVLMLDLDHFKDVNDTRGHASGDQLIRSIAQALREQLGSDGVLARLGGDEFAVLLPAAEAAEAIEVADRLRAAIAEHVILAGGRLQVTASIGVAVHSGDDATGVLSDADVAMYEAKEAGRNRVAVYRPELGTRARMEARLAWTTQLRRALDTDGFELHAQPIMALGPEADEKRFEVLLRLPQAGGPLALPADFLPVAERHGLIREIDRWVFTKAVEIAAACRAAGDPVRFEVNLSGQSMVDPNLPAFIAALLRTSEAEPSQLIFEVTETAAIDSLHEARSLAGNLVELGCEFAIDDFGAGFGSFAYLKHLPSQYVKIDGDFIRRLPMSPNDQLVVQAIGTIAAGMGKRTIAEYVETEETLELLRAYGIDFAQGYFIAKPGPIAEVLAAAGVRAGRRRAV